MIELTGYRDKHEYTNKHGVRSVVYLMDCMTAMEQMGDKEFGLAVVDPPYGLNLALNGQFKKYGGSSKWDVRPDEKYFNRLISVSENQIIWGWNYMSDMLPPCKGFIYWNKLNHHDNRADGELAWTSFDRLARHFEYMWDGNRYGKVGNIQGVGKKSTRMHPTEKPVALYDWIFHNYAKPNDTIFDSHLGSGSSRIAADKHNLPFLGTETDADYFRDHCKRFDRYAAQLTLF